MGKKNQNDKTPLDLDEFFDDTVKLELDGEEIDEETLETWRQAAKKANFVSVGEFIRYALRQVIESEEMKKALQKDEQENNPKTK